MQPIFFGWDFGWLYIDKNNTKLQILAFIFDFNIHITQCNHELDLCNWQNRREKTVIGTFLKKYRTQTSHSVSEICLFGVVATKRTEYSHVSHTNPAQRTETWFLCNVFINEPWSQSYATQDRYSSIWMQNHCISNNKDESAKEVKEH